MKLITLLPLQQQLPQPPQVSPFNTRQLGDALGKALFMTAAEADRRRQRDLPYVTTKTGSLWCKQVWYMGVYRGI
jgi:trehalose-6-phosphate synthase